MTKEIVFPQRPKITIAGRIKTYRSIVSFSMEVAVGDIVTLIVCVVILKKLKKKYKCLFGNF